MRPILLDCGDTLIDESTEAKNDRGESQRASLIPGADTLVHALKDAGHPLALCADGPVATFENLLNQHGLYNSFDAFAISGTIGVDKPDARMFVAALEGLGIPPAGYASAVMVGNNLERDIRGANALGLVTVHIAWSTKRRIVPNDASETPDFVIHEPLELLDILRTRLAT